MRTLPYRIVNVFCPPNCTLQGNALCVFELDEKIDISTSEMQQLARQLNLSETTFLHPNTGPHRMVRIFTPTTELPFAGHPTLGTSFVAHSIDGECTALQMQAGTIPVSNCQDYWKLSANPAKFRTENVDKVHQLICLAEEYVQGTEFPPTWVNSGIEQLLMQVVSVDRLMQARPNFELINALGDSSGMILVWVKEGDKITSRFFSQEVNQIIEDPGTGSACANLGRLFQSRNHFGVFK